MSVTMRRQVATITLLLLCYAATIAHAPAQTLKKATAPRVSMRAEKKKTAPQVVTIVHRLNGLKMFRVLLRSERQAMALAGLQIHHDQAKTISFPRAGSLTLRIHRGEGADHHIRIAKSFTGASAACTKA